jgi:hypothetical protein
MLEVVAGASEESPDDEFVYSLPRTVVRSFQHNVIFITISAQAIGQYKDGMVPAIAGCLAFLA